MKVVLEAGNFKRLINNSKRFLGSSDSRQNLQYIFFKVEHGTFTAQACDGFMLSEEKLDVLPLSDGEEFSGYITANIPQISSIIGDDVVIEKKKDTVILTYGNVIHKYDQPAPNNGVSYDEILEKNSLKHKKAVIQLDANKLIKALQGSKTGAYKEKIMIEIGNPREPIFIHYGADNQKMLLPIYSGN